MFELLLEIHFAINMPSVAWLLVLRTRTAFKNCELFFAFCIVILGISNISFDNSSQWIKCGYNVDKL